MEFEAAGGGGKFFDVRDVSVYLCGNTTAEDEVDTDAFCRPALTVRPVNNNAADFGATALSENGALLVMENEPGGIVLLDLRTATSLDGNGDVQAYLNVGEGGSVRSVGIAPTKGYIGTVTRNDVYVYQLARWEEPGQARVVSESVFPLETACPPFAPICAIGLPKSTHHMVMSDQSMAVGINVELGEEVTCVSRCWGFFNGIEIRVYDLDDSTLIGNVIEMGTNYSMIATEGVINRPGGLAMTPDGKILAVGSANFPRYDLDDGEQPVPYYQVDAYRLNEEDNIWEPLGSTLYGSRTNVEDNFGGSLAFSNDGTILVIGASRDSSVGAGNGRVSTYQLMRLEDRENGTLVEEWVPYLNDLTGLPGSQLGSSVDIVPSGDQLLVGAPLIDPNGIDSGEAFLYDLAGFQ
mmetsp:Transcript_9848/g.20368  ORF Transcript_9848/g.20368 Transcript_9848/m.20368 type:complete len:408 (+) Transcript_9848:909-2132(+)